MSADFCYFVRDEVGQDFLFTVADEEYEHKFRRFVQGWMRIKHDSSKHSPVGKMKVHVMPCEEYR